MHSGRTQPPCFSAAAPNPTSPAAAAPNRPEGSPQTCQRLGFHPRSALFRHAPTPQARRLIRGETASFQQLEFSTENDFAVLAATSIAAEPIASTKRLLVSAIAHVQPTGFRWTTGWKREVADPGRPPFLQEPVLASVVWRRKQCGPTC